MIPECENCSATTKEDVEEAIELLAEYLTEIGCDTPKKIISSQINYCNDIKDKLGPPPTPGIPIFKKEEK